jgi:cytoskeleton protein RodZ
VSREYRDLLKGSDPEGRQDTEGGEATPPSPPSAPGGTRLTLRPPPWDKSAAEAEPGSFGHWLRRQREVREISLREIAERTKISLRYLEAMEEDRFDLLPAPVFAKGFLREYARYVGLSPDEVVNHWLSVQPAGEDERAGDSPLSAGRAIRQELGARDARSRGRRVLVVLGILAAVALFAGLAYYALHRPARARKAPPTRPAAGAPAPARSPAGRSPIAPPPAGRGAVTASTAAGAADSAPAAGASTTGFASWGALPPPAAAVQRSADGATATATGEPSPLEMTLDFTRDCWVEVAVDGKKLLSEERVPGEALQLQAKEKVVLTLGNPSAVEALVNGYSFDLPGGRRPVHDLVIDLATVRALKDKHGAL